MLIRKTITVMTATVAVMTALVCVTTISIQVPIPATEGYFNIGDAMIMVTALTFGHIVGCFAGGVGSALADIVTGFWYFAPLSLIVKGLEGILIGKLNTGKSWKLDLLAVFVGGSEMVFGYFIGESFVMGYGIPAALVEAPGNILQVTVGGLTGILLSSAIRRYIPIQR